MSKGSLSTVIGDSDRAELLAKLAALQEKGVLSNAESANQNAMMCRLEAAKLVRRHSSVPLEADMGISPGLVRR